MRSYFRSSIEGYLALSDESVLNALEDGLAADGFNRAPDQRFAWREQVAILRTAFERCIKLEPKACAWGVMLEYAIPGRHKRLDAVVLTNRGITVIEFKAGKDAATSADKWQLLEYCWNIRDFHNASLGRLIAPILVPTQLTTTSNITRLEITDERNSVLTTQIVGQSQLSDAILRGYSEMPDPNSPLPETSVWENSRISPSQSIIEATRAQFKKHSVREIEHSHADNTDEVVQKIADIVQFSKTHRRRSICFVTGVPGAGKTLVGLRVAYLSEATALAESAPCFASGNLKLLSVLGAALGLNVARDKTDVRYAIHDVTAPLWDIHKFARTHLADSAKSPPAFRVVVFDEAQRVWTKEKVMKGAKSRFNRGGKKAEIPAEFSDLSEPEMLLRVMEFFPDWCVVVALVGGGQEIHDGEAGLSAWGEVLKRRSEHWDVWASREAIHGGSSVAGQSLLGGSTQDDSFHPEINLHLKVTRRSHRATRLTDWVNAVLDGNAQLAAEIATSSLKEFRVGLVRDLSRARKHLNDFTGDDQRIGLIASSGAKRLRAEGLEVQKAFRDALNWPKWFLADRPDIDSSNQLEVAATEFECQGLELDYTCLCWGTDFVYTANSGWMFRPSRGKKLRKPSQHSEGAFVVNKHRVLLTRAREGMIIFIPRGSETDLTRPRKLLDETADYFRACGLSEV